MAEIQQTQVLPAPFIEAAGKTYLEDLSKAVGGIKGLDLSKLYGPQFVAGPSALQTQAEGLSTGLGGYQPFLQAAQAATGPTAYQQYMSPYQQDVISTTLSEFDRQSQMGLPALQSQAIQAGAFGQGRGQVAEAEYQSASDRNRAALQAQLLQQGFGQAQSLAAQQYNQQLGLAGQTQGLLGQQIAGLSTLGAQQQAQEQAGLTAQQQLAYQQGYQPLQAAQAYGQGVTGLIAGYPGQTQIQQTPSPTALQTGLGVASTLAGIYGKLNPPDSYSNRSTDRKISNYELKYLKRPMFRKGGSVDGGVMKIANPRSNFEVGGAAEIFEENLKLLQQAAGPAGDAKQDLYDMLISGGLNLVSGEGAGKGTLGAIAQSFKKPAEQFLAARPGEEQFQRQIRLAAAQGAITQQQAKEILQKELESKEKISKMAIEAQTGNLTNIIAEEERKRGTDPVLANNIARYVTTIKPELDKKYGSSLVGGRIEVVYNDSFK
jgi:hypothetical protein